MKIYKAREMGFCVGVRRAIKVMEKVAQERGGIESLGGIVHNRQVVQRLKEKGVIVADRLDDLHSDAVAITSHGVGPQVIEELKRRKMQIIDTTCPFVRKAQRAAQSLAEAGFDVIIFGDVEHPEVVGVLGWAGEKGIATSDWKVVLASGKSLRKLGILSQTTQTESQFGEFVKNLIDACLPQLSELRVINTICDATSKRQRAALELAKKVELMLVVGGRNSANTKRLAEICAKAGVETHHIESAEEIDPAWLANRERVGVTAGASTPDYVIEEVIQRLEQNTGVVKKEPALSQIK